MNYPTATPEQERRWRLLDAIEDGTLSREQRHALSRLVRSISVSDPRYRQDYDALLASLDTA